MSVALANLLLPNGELEQGKGNLTSFFKALQSLAIETRAKHLPPGKHLGERIAQLRKRRGISQGTRCQLITWGISHEQQEQLERVLEGAWRVG